MRLLVSTMDWGPILGTAPGPGVEDSVEHWEPHSHGLDWETIERACLSGWPVTTSMNDGCLSVLSLVPF